MGIAAAIVLIVPSRPAFVKVLDDSVRLLACLARPWRSRPRGAAGPFPMIPPRIYTTCVSRDASLFQALTATDRLSELLPVLHQHAVTAIEWSELHPVSVRPHGRHPAGHLGVWRRTPAAAALACQDGARNAVQKRKTAIRRGRLTGPPRRGRISRHAAGGTRPACAHAKSDRGAGDRLRRAPLTRADGPGRVRRPRTDSRARPRPHGEPGRSAGGAQGAPSGIFA